MRRSAILISVLAIMICAGNANSGARNDSKQASKAESPAKPSKTMNHSCSSCHKLSVQEAGAVFKDIGEVKEVKASPVKGLYEVTLVAGDQQVVAYLDFGKKLLIPGPVIDIAAKRPITPPPVVLPKKISAATMGTIPIANSLIMGKADGKVRMFVFTDPDCQFCGRLHGELKKLVSMEPDLVIYIKLFPLKMHPKAYDRSRVILSNNSLELLEKAFSGKALPLPEEKDRKEPIDETIKLGESLGIRGTPAILLPDGRLFSGYMDARKLHGYLMESVKSNRK